MITKTSNPSAINGTSFHKGTIDTSLAQLENALGIEAERVLDEKVNYEFDLELADGTPFTIYDWKEGFLAPTRKVFFHIGTHCAEDTAKVCQVLADEYGLEAGVGVEYNYFLMAMLGGN